jgi:hypothetical protein
MTWKSSDAAGGGSVMAMVLKNVIVDALRWLFERSPPLAMAINRMIVRMWRRMREA